MFSASVVSALAMATLASQALATGANLPPLFAAARTTLSDICLPIVETSEQPDALLSANGFSIDKSPPVFVGNLMGSRDLIYARPISDDFVYVVIAPAPSSAARFCAVTLNGSNPMFMDSLRSRFRGSHARFVEEPGNNQPDKIIILQSVDKTRGRVERIVAAVGSDPKTGTMRTTAAILRADPPSNTAEVKDILDRCSAGEITSPLICGNAK